MSHSTHDQGIPPPTPMEARYLAVQKSAEFQDLRSRYRRWVIPVTVVSIVWYFLYVFLAAYAVDFMGDQAVRQHQRRPRVGAGPVRDHVRGDLGVRQLCRPSSSTPASAKIREEMEAEGLL